MRTGGENHAKRSCELTALNRDYVNSVQNSDVKRFDEILAEDFYCSNPTSRWSTARLPGADRKAGCDQESRSP